MHTLHIRGIEVEFPFKPYEVQLDYMTKVIESLQTGKNAILESPTGTGKTLCLLCATLAWRRAEIKSKTLSIQSNPSDKEPDYPFGWGQTDVVPGEEEQQIPSAPKIIYASRTHSQLTQVVAELKRTDYAKDTKISILGSREQLCIHPEVSQQKSNTAMIHMCRNKVNKRLCHFYNNVENVRKSGYFSGEVLDIEELVNLGNKRNACPYYAVREQSKEADTGIIFSPYNYLLDRKARRSHNLDVKGNILIFDEAHNLEKMCEESASFDLTSVDIAHCIEEMGDLLLAKCKLIETGTIPNGYEAGESSALHEFDQEELTILKVLFLALEKHLDDIELPKVDKCRTEKGRFMFEFLAQVNLNFGTHEALLNVIVKVVSYLSTLSNSFQTRGTALQKFAEIVKVVFSMSDGQSNLLPSSLFQSSYVTERMMDELSKFYRVHIQEEFFNDSYKQSSTTTKSKKPKRTLSYWCFSPGYAMRDLIACGVRNLILTSGTLSPLASFTCELQVDFPIMLQNTHVIDDHQIFVGVLSKGLSGKKLESTFKSRNDSQLTTELGQTLTRIARTVPGGLLVFFPSYAAMTVYTNCWNDYSSDIMREIDLVKPCTSEPKNKHELKQAMEKYYNDVKKPTGGTFLAVCRGKVSEGLDFANDNGRAVVIIGLPFPPSKDPKVRLKMQFLEDLRVNGAKHIITGQEWYRLQALRAVNQAIGRVIRHRFDYGAVLLCDHRFTKKENSSELPKWIHGRINTFDNCQQALRRLKAFFCSIKDKEKIRIQKLNTCDPNSVMDNKASSSDSVLKPELSANDQMFFGFKIDKRKDQGYSSQCFTKANKSSDGRKSKRLPKLNEFDDHIPSTSKGVSDSVPLPISGGSCSGCETVGKRKRDDVPESEALVLIKNRRKKPKNLGLLDALNRDLTVTNCIVEEEPVVVSEESTQRLSSQLLAMDKRLDDERRGQVKKKIKIVSKSSAVLFGKEQNDNKLSSAGFEVSVSSRSSCHVVTKLDENKLTSGTAKGYLDAIKSCFNEASYLQFKCLTASYSKTKELDPLVSGLADLFLGSETHHVLFRCFVRFIKKEQRKKFDEFCFNLTGKRYVQQSKSSK